MHVADLTTEVESFRKQLDLLKGHSANMEAGATKVDELAEKAEE